MAETYSGVIESETEERKLKVEVLVDLLVRSMDVTLQVTLILGPALIEEPVHKLATDLC